MGIIEQQDRRPSFWNVSEHMGKYLDAYTDSLEPVSPTIPQLSAMLKGGFRPGIHFIGGNTGAGKSSFCLWMMERMAQSADPDTGEPMGVTYLSLELTEAEVRARMGSRLSCALDSLEPFRWADFEELGRKQRAALEAGTYDQAHDPVYCADLELMARCPNIRIVDAVSDPSLSGITRIQTEIDETGRHRGRVLFLDYLQCIDAMPGMDETEAMKDAVRAINLAAIGAGVAVIAISAISRAKGAEMRSGSNRDKNPGADIFRGSSWIEYTGLTAFALVRREDARRVGENVEVELWPVKNRRGTCDGPVMLSYNGAYGEWTYGEA